MAHPVAQFMLAALLVSPRAAGGGCWLNLGSLAVLAAGWLVWVVMLNGGTLAFNSAHDRDSGPVAYLETPPPPPVWLGPGALALMVLGCLLAWLVVGQALALVTGVCVVLSVTYSAPPLRLKGKPGLDLLINMVGYGAGTTLAGVAGGAGRLPGRSSRHLPHHAGALLSWPQVSWPAQPRRSGRAADSGPGRGTAVAGAGFRGAVRFPVSRHADLPVPGGRQRGDRTLTTAPGGAWRPGPGPVAGCNGLGVLPGFPARRGRSGSGLAGWAAVRGLAVVERAPGLVAVEGGSHG